MDPHSCELAKGGEGLTNHVMLDEGTQQSREVRVSYVDQVLGLWCALNCLQAGGSTRRACPSQRANVVMCGVRERHLATEFRWRFFFFNWGVSKNNGWKKGKRRGETCFWGQEKRERRKERGRREEGEWGEGGMRGGQGPFKRSCSQWLQLRTHTPTSGQYRCLNMNNTHGLAWHHVHASSRHSME